MEHLGRNGQFGSAGQFGWGGAYYTAYFADPRERLVAVFMTQMRPRKDRDLHEAFRTLVYQSIVAQAPARGPLTAGPSR